MSLPAIPPSNYVHVLKRLTMPLRGFFKTLTFIATKK